MVAATLRELLSPRRAVEKRENIVVKAFYQSIHYEALRERKVRRGPLGGNITFSNSQPAARDRILDYFEEMSVERVGILRGEYLLHPGGMLLADRKGVTTSACISLENHQTAQAMVVESANPLFRLKIDELLEEWDRLPFADNLPVLCDPYSHQYYHFSLELVPRIRFFAQHRGATFVMTKNSLARPFQQDLMRRAASGMNCHLLGTGIRIRDPILAHDSMSEEGILWLREATGISARAGARRIYIRRGDTGSRLAPGGGISESPRFEALLRDFGFETVEFGNGERDVAAQIAMLEGVGLILSAHGAALTNLAYLNPDLTVIEVLSPVTPTACFMHIAATLGFDYHGIYSDISDDQSNIVVDLDELYEVLHARV